jgi:hypothetical protein
MFYTLSLPISTAIIGCDSVEQVEECVQLARDFTPLNEKQMAGAGRQDRTDCKAGTLFPPDETLTLRQEPPLARLRKSDVNHRT